MYSEQSNVKIVLENGYYYTQLENGERYQIVQQQEQWAYNKVILSPDENFVAYSTGNGLGFEQIGRDIYFCKVDGSQRTFLHRFETDVDTLLWASSGERNFIFVISRGCDTSFGGVRAIDLQSGAAVFTFAGDGLRKIPETDCYQIYCQGKPERQGRQRICVEELKSIKKPDSSNVKFFTSWDAGDIYFDSERTRV